MNLTLPRTRGFNKLLNLKFPVLDYNLYWNKQPQFQATGVLCRNYYKHDIEVKKRIAWTRPVKVPCILPEKSGDLSGLPDLDMTKAPLAFQDSAEYQSSSDLVKRVLSLQFQPRKVRLEAKINSMLERVRRHKYDNKSVECKIAKYTAIIRNMQQHTVNCPMDKKARADVKEIIEFRKKRMKLLRKFDYKRFEWLLEQLDLLYKPCPSVYERVERKKSMRRLTAQYIENVKEKKLEEYRKELDSKKLEFLQSKISTMKAIVEEEKSFGVEPSFTPEQIKEEEDKLRLRVLEEQKEVKDSDDIVEQY